MELRRLPAEEAAVRRYTEELWIPYNRDLAAAVEGHALDDSVDVVEEDVEFRLDRLESDSYEVRVAVEPAPDEPADAGVADAEGELLGFVSWEVEEAPSVFEWPDRLVVGDLYVVEGHRGEGLAQTLMARAAERAREAGCERVELDVDVDNERALAFYEKLGFEPRRYRMTVDADALDV